MASDLIVQRIPTSPAPFTPTTPDFTGFVKQQLGDIGTGSDGFDALFAVTAQALHDDAGVLQAFDVDLADLAFNVGEFAATYFAPIDGALPGLLHDGEQLNAAIQNPAPMQSTPTINVPSAPPTSTGSAGGVDTSGGGGDTSAPPSIPPQTPTGPVDTGSGTPNVPPEGPGGTIDANSGQTGTVNNTVPSPPDPGNIPLEPSPFAPPDVLPPPDLQTPDYAGPDGPTGGYGDPNIGNQDNGLGFDLPMTG